MALALIITNAGRQALIDGETITHLSIGTSGYTATATATGLRNEVARVSVSGSSPMAGQLQIQAIDESTNVYACRELGLITDQGTLFAVYAQAGVLIEKSSAAALVITADLAISSEDAASITFGNTNFLQPSATTQRAGIVQLDDSYTSTSQTKAPTANALSSLYDWVVSAITTATPPGAVAAFATPNAPSGWLECSGQAVSRSQYAALFVVIGTRFGHGNGSTTFDLPDLRGEFIRGWDNERGIDVGRTLGSHQTDELKSHSHTVPEGSVGNANNGSQIYASGDDFTSDVGSWSSTGKSGGAETRPRNIALFYCIKV